MITMGSRRSAMTIVELLVAAAIMGIVLLVVGTFFASQASTANDVQDRNELNMRLRAVAEGIAQDMQMAGARAVVEDGVPRYVSNVEGSCGVVYVSCATPTVDDLVLSVFYASSLRPQLAGTGGVCRNVVFRLSEEEGILYRTDVECGDSIPATDFDSEFARGITGLTLNFTCTIDDGTPTTDPSTCFTTTGRGVRSGGITIEGRSLTRAGTTGSLTLDVTMPNTRMDN